MHTKFYFYEFTLYRNMCRMVQKKCVSKLERSLKNYDEYNTNFFTRNQKLQLSLFNSLNNN